MDGLVQYIYLSHSHFVRTFESETIVDGDDSVSVVGHSLEPAVVALVVTGASDESASEHKYDGRLCLPVDLGDAALCRVIDVKEELAGVSFDEKVCSVRGNLLSSRCCRECTPYECECNKDFLHIILRFHLML